MVKKHVAFIISDKPIDLSSFNEMEEGVQHFIHEELEIKSGDCSVYEIEHEITKYMVDKDLYEEDGSKRTLKSMGGYVAKVVLHWLEGLTCRTGRYKPQREVIKDIKKERVNE
ncbi:hypothetical protein C0583_02585 [Candidatus Parcubacteria bacterium]|nr:MAG: hypothetical protein C0583_02585 [Candidatus Parcubacteria bacterium]